MHQRSVALAIVAPANIVHVIHCPESAPSLRACKAARTRAELIDAAVDLCLSRGYEHTIEHIAAAADVSPRTCSRYFASKDAVFVAVLDDLAGGVAVELRAVSADLGPLEAMRVALGAVLARAPHAVWELLGRAHHAHHQSGHVV